MSPEMARIDTERADLLRRMRWLPLRTERRQVLQQRLDALTRRRLQLELEEQARTPADDGQELKYFQQ